MPKKKTKRVKKNSNKNKIQKKTIAVFFGIVILLLVGTLVWAAKKEDNGVGVSGDAFRAWSNWVRGMNNIKNEKSGCCMPYCEDLGKTECDQKGGNLENQSCEETEKCKLGCCQIDCVVKEDFPEKSCTHIDGDWNPGVCKIGCCQSDSGSKEVTEKICMECIQGTSWEEGKCGPGFWVEMTSTYNTTIGGKPFTQTVDIELHTCEDTVFSPWRGKEIIKTNGGYTEVPFYVDFTDGWTDYFNGGAMVDFEGSVTEGKMTMDLRGGLPADYHHHFEDNIRSGYVACQKEL